MAQAHQACVLEQSSAVRRSCALLARQKKRCLQNYSDLLHSREQLRVILQTQVRLHRRQSPPTRPLGRLDRRYLWSLLFSMRGDRCTKGIVRLLGLGCTVWRVGASA
jgi:hypothetical protein